MSGTIIIFIVIAIISIYGSSKNQNKGRGRQSHTGRGSQNINSYSNKNANNNMQRRPSTAGSAMSVRPQQRTVSQMSNNSRRNGTKVTEATQSNRPAAFAAIESEDYRDSEGMNFSQEGRQNEALGDIHENADEAAALSIVDDESFIDITEDLTKSILAAEILGLPRALKPNIR